MAYAATDTTTMRPKVAYFANQLADLQGHGIARYSVELLSALRKLELSQIVPVSGWSALPADELARRQKEMGLKLTGLGRRGTSMLWTFLGLPTLESRLTDDIDVVHAVSLGYPVATRKPLVVTIHDLGPLTHPEFFKNTRPWVMERSLKQAVDRADAIVCVSQSTADEVLEYVGHHIEHKITVVLEGVSDHFYEVPAAKTLDGLPTPDDNLPFILSAGANSPRKNLKGLLEAMRLAMDEIPHNLYLVGGSGWDTDAFSEALSDPKLAGRVHRLGYVSDEELHALYHAADAYVHPSLYEGFGLPLLEAMACGTPVIASNQSSLPEVAGQAARLTDSSNPEQFAADLIDVCTSEETRKNMSTAGIARAREFQWSKSAQAMTEIYADLATRARS